MSNPRKRPVWFLAGIALWVRCDHRALLYESTDKPWGQADFSYVHSDIL